MAKVFTTAPTATEKTERYDLPRECKTEADILVKPTEIRANASICKRGTATKTPSGSPPNRIERKLSERR